MSWDFEWFPVRSESSEVNAQLPINWWWVRSLLPLGAAPEELGLFASDLNLTWSSLFHNQTTSIDLLFCFHLLSWLQCLFALSVHSTPPSSALWWDTIGECVWSTKTGKTPTSSCDPRHHTALQEADAYLACCTNRKMAVTHILDYFSIFWRLGILYQKGISLKVIVML